VSGLAVAAALATTVACNQAVTTTSPSTTTVGVTAASVTETMAGVLPVGGSRFYSFSIAQAGTVTATLTAISGDSVPGTVVVNMGIGSPSGTTCSGGQTAVQVTGDAGVTSQVTASEQPGLYCVIVADVGNLFSPAQFTVSIQHP